MVINNSRKISHQSDRFNQIQSFKISFWLRLFSSMTGWCLLQANPLKAQIATDDTVGTQVNTTDNVTEITGGTKADSNLFHSFSEFSVETGGTAFFNNATDISNIIGRVTGSNISNIDGLIRANGSANLILINPNGISFGANAQLDIGGAFLGSSANSVIFADGTTFSASDTQVNPILTVSVPVGLQLGTNSGEINIAGNGHSLSVADPLFSPITFNQQSGLRVKAGQTLALVGGEINFDGGTVAAPGGNIELGSVAEGLVNINFSDAGLSLGYADITALDNIQLRSQSLVDVSGTQTIAGGSIAARGNQITINDGSLFLVQNLAPQTAGNININALESLTVSGTNQDITIRSSLTNETLGVGAGGDIQVNTSQLRVEQGATIVTKTLSPVGAPGGNVEIDANDVISVRGSSAINPEVTSTIGAATFGTGKGGNNTITTNFLNATDGGTIVATALDAGDGGDISITANAIELTGVEPTIFAASAISASTLGEGNAGNLTIATKTLSLLAGGRVDASTAAEGNAGDIAIAATNGITIDGAVPNSANPSLIIASANTLDSALRELLRLPDSPSGDSGNITLTTSQLDISGGGQLTVRNDGTGDAGTINLEAEGVTLAGGSGITAATQLGEGGELNLQVTDTISLSGSSQISSNNLGTGAGGTISLETGNLQISDRSLISATTFGAGDGGNIDISASSINITGTGFVEFRDNFQTSALTGTLTPEDLTLGTGIIVGTAATGKGGDLIIDTQSLSLTEGAIVFSPVFTEGTGGNIDIAADNINISASALQMGTAGILESSSSGEIDLNVRRLDIQDGGTIVNTTLGNASAGNIKIVASESIEIKNTPVEALTLSGIYANTFGTAAGGNIDINTPQLKINDGLIGSNTGGVSSDDEVGIIDTGGSGGNIDIQATNIEVGGIPDNPDFTSGIGTSSYSDSNAGNLTITTNKLTIKDGADFATATIGAGNGGQMSINAAESIELIGITAPNGSNRGGLLATSGRSNFPELEATGTAGNINLTTSELIIRDGASIDVQSLGVGNAGSLQIEANNISLSNFGEVTGTSQVSQGGNIDLKAQNTISVGGNSQISSDNRGAGSGGTVNIETDYLQVSDRSFITTTTFGEGDGGNINIQATDIDIIGAGFAEFKDNFQTGVLDGSIEIGKGTGIFIGTITAGKSGNLTIDTDSLNLSEGSIIFSTLFGSGQGGSVTLNASDININASAIQGGGARASTSSSLSGNFNINTDRLIVEDGGTISNGTLGDAAGGNINISATDFIELRNSPSNTIVLTGISSNTFSGSGEGGDIDIKTGDLTINDAIIASNTGLILNNGTIIPVGGLGGNIEIEATGKIEAQGIPFEPVLESGISTSSFSDRDAGDLTISAANLVISEGANFSSATLGAGNSGQLLIDATESVELIGITTIDGINRGGLLATSGRIEFPNIMATGASGEIRVNTPELTVRDGASIDVQSLDVGDAGNLEISAEQITLDDGGSLSAATQSGVGGNIDLSAGSIFWLGGSTTNAQAVGTGNGGNITIDTNNLVVLEGSRLQADAVEGRGGNIQIDTQGLFICETCRVSASSRLGVDGVVQIETLQPNTQLEVLDIPQQPTQPQETVAVACPANAQANTSELTITGRGGLPPRPLEPLNSPSLAFFANPDSASQPSSTPSQTNSLLPSPARSWYLDSQGKLILSAQAADTVVDNSPHTGVNCHL